MLNISFLDYANVIVIGPDSLYCVERGKSLKFHHNLDLDMTMSISNLSKIFLYTTMYSSFNFLHQLFSIILGVIM